MVTNMTISAISLLLCCFCVSANRYIIYNDDGQAALEVRFQDTAVLMYTDEGTGAYDYLSIWEPAAQENFLIIGMRAQPDWEPMNGVIEMIRGVTPEMAQRYLRHPFDFVQIWRDEGGFGASDVAFWRPSCVPGFRSIGDIAYSCSWPCGWPKPLAYLTRTTCVSEELLEPCTFKPTPVWTNEGGWENEQGSVWAITEDTSGFWMGNKGWVTLPNLGRAYCLKEATAETTTQATTTTSGLATSTANSGSATNTTIPGSMTSTTIFGSTPTAATSGSATTITTSRSAANTTISGATTTMTRSSSGTDQTAPGSSSTVSGSAPSKLKPGN